MRKFFRKLLHRPTDNIEYNRPVYCRKDPDDCSDINISGSEMFNFKSELEDGSDECYVRDMTYYRKDFEQRPEDEKFLRFIIGNYDYGKMLHIDLEYRSKNEVRYSVIFNDHIFDDLTFKKSEEDNYNWEVYYNGGWRVIHLYNDGYIELIDKGWI